MQKKGRPKRRGMQKKRRAIQKKIEAGAQNKGKVNWLVAAKRSKRHCFFDPWMSVSSFSPPCIIFVKHVVILSVHLIISFSASGVSRIRCAPTYDPSGFMACLSVRLLLGTQMRKQGEGQEKKMQWEEQSKRVQWKEKKRLQGRGR